MKNKDEDDSFYVVFAGIWVLILIVLFTVLADIYCKARQEKEAQQKTAIIAAKLKMGPEHSYTMDGTKLYVIIAGKPFRLHYKGEPEE